MTYRTATSCGSLSKEEIVRRRIAGVVVSEIAREAGVSTPTLYNALSAWGLTTPKGGDRRTRDWREKVAASIADVSTKGRP